MRSQQSSFDYGVSESAQERELQHVPNCYQVPLEQRPGSSSLGQVANVPLIDVAALRGSPEQRAAVVKDIGNACRRMGFFQIINHRIREPTMKEALSVASNFFYLPTEEKMKYTSNDVHEPARYCTIMKDGMDKTQYWRVFLKHYSHPLEDWIQSWPNNPSTYREKMGKYSAQVRKVAMELTGAITESLGIGPTYLPERMEGGMQVMAVNGYPPCPNPDVTLGLPPHSDFSCLTIVLQSSLGLQILDPTDQTWKLVPTMSGALQVHVRNHLEVLSNGLYRSVLHRAVLNQEATRVSIGSFHSLGLDEKMEPAQELVSQQSPRAYKASSFRDFLDFLSANDISEGKSFIDTLRINN